MRSIKQRNSYKRDVRRESAGKYRNILKPGGELQKILLMLANDESLPASYHDHPLHHNLEGLRGCHLRHDFLLVYRYEGEDWLILEGLGSHSEILGL